MRVIGGKLRGKSINFLKSKKTRPLKDSVRENIFNILMHSNLIKVNDVDVLTFWPLINKKLKKKRIKLYCASKQSELVKKKLVKYKSIKEFNSLQLYGNNICSS